jgi:hypothetical protein
VFEILLYARQDPAAAMSRSAEDWIEPLDAVAAHGDEILARAMQGAALLPGDYAPKVAHHRTTNQRRPGVREIVVTRERFRSGD